MKSRKIRLKQLFILIFVVLVTMNSQYSYAGFRLLTKPKTTIASVARKESASAKFITKLSARLPVFMRPKFKSRSYPAYVSGHDKGSGSFGTASALCALVGYAFFVVAGMISLPVTSVIFITLGILTLGVGTVCAYKGLGRGRTNKGLAIIGLIFCHIIPLLALILGLAVAFSLR